MKRQHIKQKQAFEIVLKRKWRYAGACAKNPGPVSAEEVLKCLKSGTRFKMSRFDGRYTVSRRIHETTHYYVSNDSEQ